MLTIFILIVLLFSIIIHEIAHGSVAYYLGDPTAKYAGRLTLNPLKHLDPFGSVILPLLLLLVTAGRGPIFGWAKPVPINPYNFRDQKWGTLKVSIAGPGSNIGIALLFGFAARFLPLNSMLKGAVIHSFLRGDTTGLLSLIQGSFMAQIFFAFSIIAIINLLLALFNLVPVPPLDGSHILFSFLSERWRNVKIFLNQYGLFVLIFFIFFGLQWVFRGVILLYLLIVGL